MLFIQRHNNYSNPTNTNKNFDILNIGKGKQANQIEVDLLVGEEQCTFTIEVRDLGFSTPVQLDKILMHETVKSSQDFIEILYRFQDGEPLEFSITLKET